MRVVLLSLGALALAACSSMPHGSSYKHLAPGMTHSDVRKAMGGCPSSTANVGTWEAYVYDGERVTFWQWNTASFVFVFNGDSLVEFGKGSVRQDGPKLVRVPPVKPAKPGQAVASNVELKPACGAS